tara:strand:- start:732 stop:887 length:156 start_codon:yes stop_codon:yes gene_type:complete
LHHPLRPKYHAVACIKDKEKEEEKKKRRDSVRYEKKNHKTYFSVLNIGFEF